MSDEEESTVVGGEEARLNVSTSPAQMVEMMRQIMKEEREREWKEYYGSDEARCAYDPAEEEE